MQFLKSKKSVLLIISVTLIVALLLLIFVLSDKGYRSISVTDIAGTVIAENNGNSYAAYKNMNIEGGYQLKTESDSHTFMLLDDDKYVKLEEESHAVFEDLGSNKARNTVIRVEKGTLTSEIVRPLSTEESYVVNTPNAVLSVRGTYFKVCVSKDSSGDYYTDVYTYGGAVACRRVMPDGTIVDEEVLISDGYKARVKMDEVITIYVEELIEEAEDKVDPIELREVGDNDLVGIYNASIHGHKMFRDSETLWVEIEDRGIDVNRHRSPYDNKPVEPFDKGRHGNDGKHEGGDGHKHEIDAPHTDITTADFGENEQNTESTTERENEITTDVEETQITTNGGVDGVSHAQSSVSTARPNSGVRPSIPVTGPNTAPTITTVPVSHTNEVTTVTTAETEETTTGTESAESTGTTELTEDTEITEISDEETTTTTKTVVTGPSWINTGAIGTTVPSSATEETTASVTEETTTTTTTTTTEAHVCEFADYISDNNATCTEDGTKTAECECGKTDTITDIGSATGHTEKTETTDPTCTEAGKTVVSCEVCGETISEEEIPALGHTEKTETTAPDCTNTGKTVVSCEVCGETISEEEIPALGHTEVEETVEPTFAAEGLYTKSCSVCGETLETEVLERLPALYTEDGDISITATGYTQGDAAEETPFTGDYVISQRDSSTAVDCAIAVESGTHNVTLDGVNTASTGRMGLRVMSGAIVNIKGTENNNILTALDEGNENAGYTLIYNNGTISFESGTFNFINYEQTSGVSSCVANGGVIEISNCHIEFEGNYGIVNDGIININNGEVQVIGTGLASENRESLNINGGNVIFNGAFSEQGDEDNETIVLGGSFKVTSWLDQIITNGTDELECIVFDTFPTEAQRTFINSDGTSYVYALTEEDKADDGKYYVWKPVGMIAINEVNFPDEVFRENIVRYADDDDNGYLTTSEIEAVTRLMPSSMNYGRGITSLKGIEYFTKLEYLDCSGNVGFTEFDISKNTALTYLDCSDSGITSLDVSKNTALETLRCSDNDITELDVSNNTELKTLMCDVTQITSLDISNNVALTYLGCSMTGLTSLDVTNNTELTNLYCYSTSITSLNVSQNTKLLDLQCNSSLITSLNISNNTALTMLKCYNTGITSLDVSNNIALSYLYCYNTGITSLDISNNTALTELDCSDASLPYIDLTNNISLTEFSGYGNAYVIPSNAITFDTSTIAGFDPTKVSNVTNADFDSTTGIFTNITGDITYTYDCGQGYSETFTLTRTG